MLDYAVRSMPIVEGSAVVGIVSRSDLVRTLVRSDDMIRAEVATRLATYTGGLEHWEAGADGRGGWRPSSVSAGGL